MYTAGEILPSVVDSTLQLHWLHHVVSLPVTLAFAPYQQNHFLLSNGNLQCENASRNEERNADNYINVEFPERLQYVLCLTFGKIITRHKQVEFLIYEVIDER